MVGRAIRLLHAARRSDEAGRILRLVPAEALSGKNWARLEVDLALNDGDFDRALARAEKVVEGTTGYQDHLWFARVVETVRQARGADNPTKVDAAMRERVETHLRKAIAADDGELDAWLLLIRFLAANQQAEEAEALLPKALAAVDATEHPLAAARCYEALGKFEEASRTYDSANDETSRFAALKRSVGMHLRNAENDRAASRLQAWLAANADRKPEELIWARRTLATALVRLGGLGRLRQASSLIDENLLADPTSRTDLWHKALILSSHPMNERRREAVVILRGLQAELAGPSADVQMLLASIHAGMKEWREAAEQLRPILPSNGDNPPVLSLYVNALLERAETAEAKVWLKRLEKVAPNTIATRLLQAKAAFRDDKYEMARQLLDPSRRLGEVEGPNPGAVLLLAARQCGEFATALSDEGRAEAAAPFVEQACALHRRYSAKHPGDALLTAAFLAKYEAAEAIALLEKSSANARPLTIGKTIDALIRHQPLTRDQLNRIAAVLRRTAEKHPDLAPLSFLDAELKLRLGEYEEAKDVYRGMLRRDPKSVSAMNNLALLLTLTDDDLQEALRLVSEAIQVHGSTPALLDTRATVYLAHRKLDRAISDAKQAAEALSDPAPYFHLAMAHWKSGNKPEAAEALKKSRELGLSIRSLHPLEKDALDQLSGEIRQ